MNRTLFLSLAMLAAITASLPADARRGEQDDAREDMQQGKVKSLREIEGNVVPRMRGMQYLGPEYDPSAQVYRLKFINKDRVIFVDVDGKTGGVLRQR
ncbi:hypothetical protein EUU23_07005 [Sphingorhabdus sp. IMCC26285]|uniref:PepSY domain-containing protein n=1 Tax=Sphingorhabdus profundilacus TaxID=2509718 RepID=A0A6I4LZD9_9SPHN|nr:hypothetical protein [Sphingorhabdus profundilacus]